MVRTDGEGKTRQNPPAGVYKVGDRFEWHTRHDRGTADTSEEARAAKAKAESAGPVPRVVRGTFGEYARTWLAGYQGRTSRGFTEGTRAGYRESLELYAIPYFEARGLKPHQIQRRHVKAFIAWLGGGADRSRAPPEDRATTSPRRPHRRQAPRADQGDVRRRRRRRRPARQPRDRPHQHHQHPLGAGRTATRCARSPTSSSPPSSTPPRERGSYCCSTLSPRPAPAGASSANGAARTSRTGPDGPVLRVRRAYADKARDDRGQARRDRQAPEVRLRAARPTARPRPRPAPLAPAARPRRSSCSPRLTAGAWTTRTPTPECSRRR